MLKKIIIEPDPILRKKCEPLEKVDTDIKKLMNDETYLHGILNKGGEKARVIAEENLKNVREKVGLI